MTRQRWCAFVLLVALAASLAAAQTVHNVARLEIEREDPNDPLNIRFKDADGDIHLLFDQINNRLVCEPNTVYIGDGTAQDLTILFDDDNADLSLLFDDSLGQFVLNTGFMSVRGSTVGVAFDDTDFTGSPYESALIQTCAGSDLSENCYIDVNANKAGAYGRRLGFGVNTSGDPYLAFAQQADALITYSSSFTLNITGAEGYLFDDYVGVQSSADPNDVVSWTAPATMAAGTTAYTWPDAMCSNDEVLACQSDGTTAWAVDAGAGGGESNVLASPDLGAEVDLINSVSKTGVALNLVSLEADDFSATSNIITIDDDSHAHTSATITLTDIDTDFGNETVTSTWTINDLGTGDLTEYDLTVGNSANYGIQRIGDAVFGRTSHTAADGAPSYNLNGAFIFQNVTGPVTGDIEFGFLDSAGLLRFGLPKSAVGNATYNPRCFLNAGPAIADSDIVTVGYWQGTGIFDNLTCDTSSNGADMGVQNSLEVEDTIFVDIIAESTTASGVTIDGMLIKDAHITEADISDLSHTADTNANTICTGTDVYLDGEGNCDTISGGGGGSDFLGFSGEAATVAKGATEYLGVSGGDAGATEANAAFYAPAACTLQNLRTYVSANASNNAANLITVRLNIAACNSTALQTSYGAGVTGLASDTSGTCTVAAGDRIAFEVVNTGSGGGTRDIVVASISVECAF